MHAVALLQLMLARGVGPKVFRDLLAKVDNQGIPLEEAVKLSPTELAERFGLGDDVASGIAAGRDVAETLAEQLKRRKVEIVVRGGEGYPERLERTLGHAAPSWLFVHGNIDHLRKPSVGFSGSRKASEQGLLLANSCAGLLAGQGINVVSGYANGVDHAAHRAALAAGGITTCVLAEGILNFRRKREIAELLSGDDLVVVSEFKPRTPWAAQNAMRRNITICGLSDAVIVVEAGVSGGSLAAGVNALRLGRPLFVAEYANPPQSAAGNSMLLAKGAHPLPADRQGNPSVREILLALDEPEPLQGRVSQAGLW